MKLEIISNKYGVAFILILVQFHWITAIRQSPY